MTDYLVPDNLVQKAGWFAARSFEGTATPASGLIKVKCGTFKPKFCINAEVYTADFATISKAVVDLTPVFEPAVGTTPGYWYLPLHTDATAESKYRVLVME